MLALQPLLIDCLLLCHELLVEYLLLVHCHLRWVLVGACGVCVWRVVARFLVLDQRCMVLAFHKLLAGPSHVPKVPFIVSCCFFYRHSGVFA